MKWGCFFPWKRFCRDLLLPSVEFRLASVIKIQAKSVNRESLLNAKELLAFTRGQNRSQARTGVRVSFEK